MARVAKAIFVIAVNELFGFNFFWHSLVLHISCQVIAVRSGWERLRDKNLGFGALFRDALADRSSVHARKFVVARDTNLSGAAKEPSSFGNLLKLVIVRGEAVLVVPAALGKLAFPRVISMMEETLPHVNRTPSALREGVLIDAAGHSQVNKKKF